MTKNWLAWARIIYSVPILFTGVIYLWRPQEAIETLTSFIPGGLGIIYVAGALWLLFGSMIALHFKPKWGAWGVICTLVMYQIMVHIPALYTGEYLVVVWFELLRDLSLMGGAIFLLAFLEQEDHEYSESVKYEEWETTVH